MDQKLKEALWELIKDANMNGRGRLDSHDPEWIKEDEDELREEFEKLVKDE